MQILLPGERPISWNAFYSGKHWSYRNMIALDIHQKITLALREQNITLTHPQFFEEKVNIRITAYYKTTHIDSDNITAKLYIDGMKGLILHDDYPKYVGDVITRSQKGDKNYVIIDITPDSSID